VEAFVAGNGCTRENERLWCEFRTRLVKSSFIQEDSPEGMMKVKGGKREIPMKVKGSDFRK
jgi:hypothetical protein